MRRLFHACTLCFAPKEGTDSSTCLALPRFDSRFSLVELVQEMQECRRKTRIGARGFSLVLVLVLVPAQFGLGSLRLVLQIRFGLNSTRGSTRFCSTQLGSARLGSALITSRINSNRFPSSFRYGYEMMRRFSERLCCCSLLPLLELSAYTSHPVF